MKNILYTIFLINIKEMSILSKLEVMLMSFKIIKKKI